MRTDSRLDLIRKSHLRLRRRQQEKTKQREVVKSLALDILRRFSKDPSALSR